MIENGEYVRRYTDFYANPKLKQSFPALNDTVTLKKQLGFKIIVDQTLYRFSGFDYNSIWLQPLSEELAAMRMKMDSLATIIDQQGKKMSGQYIRSFVLRGEVPLCSELVLRVNDEMQRFAGENITKIELPKSPTGRIIGGLAGFCVDIVVFRAMAWQINKEKSSGFTLGGGTW